MRELHAWENGHHVGVFSEDDEERISFAYDANEGLPISLSLPRTGGWKDQAPRNFLDNLLPDNPNVRQAMREHLNASSAGVFDLLDRVDATGGLVFSLSPEPPIPSPTLRLISDSQIANEIDRIERTRNYWWDEDSHCRFSLGGAQGKFTLSRVDGKWYWPDMMLPSTHIVKPKPHDLPEATKVELATMRLSELCGIDTPARGEITAQRKTAYIVERFDRRLEEGRIVRLRQEDFLQALGLPTQDKYDPSADDCLDLLQRIDASGSLSYRWLERLAFNTSSANSDAHAKNYSLILDPASGIRLSPQYDAVATRYWPEFSWELTMPLNEDHAFAEHTTPQDWEDLATRHGLDGPRVADMARRMAGKVLAGISESCEGLDARMANRLNTCWTKANESIEPIMPGDEPANSLDPASALPDSLRFPSSGHTI